MPEKLECPHGYASRGSCVDCMEDGPVAAPARWEKIGGAFQAYFGGECPGCDRPIHAAASRVQRWDKSGGAYPDRTAYTHEHCGSPR